MDNLENIINALNGIINQIEKPLSTCMNEQGYIQTEISRINNSFSNQQVGMEIERMLKSALNDVVYSADQLVNAQENIKRIILSCSSN